MTQSTLSVRYIAVVQGADWTAKGIRSYRVRKVRADYWTARLLRYLPTVVA